MNEVTGPHLFRNGQEYRRLVPRTPISASSASISGSERFLLLTSGSVMGHNALPDGTGLDLDDFPNSGNSLACIFERLGTARCQYAASAIRFRPSRWPLQSAPHNFHKTVG